MRPAVTSPSSLAPPPRLGYLQSRLLWIVLAVAAPLTVLLALSILDARRAAEHEAFTSLRQRADQAADRMFDMLEKTEHLLDFMASRQRLREMRRDACESMVAGVSGSNTFYTNIGLIDTGGVMVCSSAPSPGRTRFGDFAWFRAGFAADGIWLSDPLRGPISGRMVQYMTLAVRDASGAKVGLLAASIDLAPLNRALEPLVSPPGASVGIRKDAVFVTRLPQPERWMGRPVPATLLEPERLGDTQVRVGIGVDGTRRAFAVAPLPKYGLEAAAGMPEHAVYEEANAEALRRALAAALTIAVALIGASLAARRLAGSLRSIADTARRLHAGATDVRADATLPGEFGEVAVEFNRLMDRNDERAAQLVQSEQRAVRLRRFHETLSAVGQAIARQAAPAELYEEVCRACTQSGLATAAWISRPAQEDLRIVAQAPGAAAGLPVHWGQREAGVTRAAVRRRGPVQEACGEGVCVAAIPLLSADDVTGALTLRGDHGMRFDGELAQLLAALAREISFGLDLEKHRAERVALDAAKAESRAKTTFLSHVSHELRTPLNAVLGFSQLVRTKAEARADEEDREHLGHVLAAGRQLKALIDDLMDVSRIEVGELAVSMADVDVVGKLAGVLQLSRPVAELHRVSLHLEAGDASALVVRTDPVRLRQVLMNLVSNAIKYNRPGGHVWAGVQADARQVHIRIRDDGVGMAPAQLDGLFQAFNRLGRERSGIEGTGIGLVITRRLVELLGGRLAVESREGAGTTVAVTLPNEKPLGEAVPSVLGDLAAAPEAQPAEGLVLYIEDHPVNAVLVEQVLAQVPGVEVMVCATGEEGLRFAAECQPHLVLLDMQLPDIQGIEVLARLRSSARTASIRVIALSASAMPQEVEAALRAGAQAYWTKPIDFHQLRSGVAKVLREESARRQRAAASAQKKAGPEGPA
ncbi:ATP-binding protein [Aquincola sp. MAHUQ-54]|uniref:histidine kinase n=1 Tax=Aquincola agrisoli TaxID=3119538 RepID=A0AAW9Q935_9BURK